MNNKRGIAQSITFLIIAVAIALVTIVSIYLLKGVNTSVDSTKDLDMINTLKTHINDMLNENAGVQKVIILKPSKQFVKFCFVDYDGTQENLGAVTTDPYEIKVSKIAKELKKEYDAGNLSKPNNFFSLTETGFDAYYVDKITVEPTNGIYCINSAKTLRITLESKGKKILVKQ